MSNTKIIENKNLLWYNPKLYMENKQIKKNDEIEVVIDRQGSNGEGVATVDGKIVFVPFALPKEKVLIKIINDKNSFLIGKLIKVIYQSDSRCEPRCPNFSKCGGCDIQHLNYDEQINFKTELVQKTLKKYAKINKNPEKTEKSEKIWRYRNKFAFPVASQNGRICIGMYRKNSHQIIEVEDCLLQSELASKIVKIFKAYMIENNISAYNEETKTGIVKHIVCRENDGKFILTVVVTDEKFNNFEPLISKLKTQFHEFGLYKNVNKLKNNVIFGNLDTHIYGLKELEIEEFGIKYYVNNRSFLQVNSIIKTKIYNKILELVEGEKIVIDAYSGAGLLSSIIARHATSVYGVEIVKEATENAEKLKKLNNLNNLTNINGDCAKVLPELAKNLKDFAIVIDPPRKGVDKKVCEAFLIAEPRKIIYLSCDPATLARDLAILSEKYKIVYLKPWDMFPQTANVETLVCLEKK